MVYSHIYRYYIGIYIYINIDLGWLNGAIWIWSSLVIWGKSFLNRANCQARCQPVYCIKYTVRTIEIAPVHQIEIWWLPAEFPVRPPASTGPTVGDGIGRVLVMMTMGVEGGGAVVMGSARDSEVTVDMRALELGND